MRHVQDKRIVRNAVLSIPPGQVFTAADVMDLIGNKAPSAQTIGWYLRIMGDLIERVPTNDHNHRPWRRLEAAV